MNRYHPLPGLGALGVALEAIMKHNGKKLSFDGTIGTNARNQTGATAS